MRLFANDLGVDLGTANVLIYVDKKGIVVREPSVVAMDCNNGRLLQVGTEAKNMLGRTPGKLEAMRPLKEGIVADHAMAVQLLRDLFRRASSKALFSPKPRVVISVPSYITEVQSRTLINVAIEAGAGRVFLVESPLAAAFGANLDIGGPKGHMVVDVGAGVTNIAVLSMNGVVSSTAIRVAGDNFDDAIIRYIRHVKHLIIGKEVAEDIKIRIGCVDPQAKEATMEVSGLDSGRLGVKDCIVTSTELAEVLARPAEQIAEAVLAMLESSTPELVRDIEQNGITLTGGGSQLGGLCQMIELYTGVACNLADDPASCVVYGCGKSLAWIHKQKEGAVNYDKERAMKGKTGGRR